VGTWGTGNLDGDSPRDFLADMTTVWERIIDRVLARDLTGAAAFFGPGVAFTYDAGLEAIEACVMPTVEVIIAVAGKLECDSLPSPEKVSEWAQEVLRVWDAESPSWGWNAEDQAERRSVIAGTFDRLLRVVGGRHGDPSRLDASTPEK
jgi:hypothetical protein